MDSDDWLEENALEEMYNMAKENNSDIVICDMVDCYEDGTTVYHNCTIYSSVYQVSPSASNKIFKKESIRDVLFLENKWYEDFNFTTKLLLKNIKISVISKPFYNCHVRTSSTMNNNNSIKNLDMIDVIDDLISYAKNNNLYNDNIFKYLIFDHILITTINRVSIQRNSDTKKVISTLRRYCHDNLINYKKSPFYKTIPRKRKIIANLNYYGLNDFSKIILLANAKLKGGFYGKVKHNNSSL